MTQEEAFAVLGLKGPATPEAVKAAYRKQAAKAHPDVPGGSAAAFQRLHEAYEFLLSGKGSVRKAVRLAELYRRLRDVNEKIHTQEGIQKTWHPKDFRRDACMKPLLAEKTKIEAELIELGFGSRR